jgi:hypothetical protein
MDKEITETTFNQLLVAINFNLFSKIVTELELDKYIKNLKTKKLFQILLYGQLESISFFDSLSIDVSNKSNLQKEIDLNAISDSQLSRRLREIFRQLFLKKYLIRLNWRLLPKEELIFTRIILGVKHH